jgi:ABC-type sugar transport system permease subunit
MKKWKLSLHKKRALYGLVFVSPWIIGILLFFVNPILRTIQFSFSEIIIDPRKKRLQHCLYRAAEFLRSLPDRHRISEKASRLADPDGDGSPDHPDLQLFRRRTAEG